MLWHHQGGAIAVRVFQLKPSGLLSCMRMRQGTFMFKLKEQNRSPEKGPVKKETGLQTALERETSSGQHTIIQSDLQITGDLVSTGDIHVEGTIHGNITCRTLTLTGLSGIQGTVKAETVRVSGIFDGKLEAKMVSLAKTARMTGEIYYKILEINPGASFAGAGERAAVGDAGANRWLRARP